jgi:ankyrin repeat protein
MSTFGFGGAKALDSEIDESTPFVAASDGDLTLLQQSLVKLNVPPGVTDDNGLTPLHNAVSYNQAETIRWLLGQKVDVNAQDSDGDTPLHHCDNVEAAKILIQEGQASYKIQNSQGKTALQLKEEELKEAASDMDEGESDDDETANLDQLVGYLKSLP